MILTVTLNPAIDITYQVDALNPGAIHRVSHVDERLGGKGLNVASVLRQLGEPVRATGLLRDGPEDFLPIAAGPRRTVVVAAGSQATGFWEPGPAVNPLEWADFTVHFTKLAASAQVVVLSGSLPPGLPDHAYASLIGLARSAGCRTILDTSGPALAAGLLAAPDVVKPNADEAAALTGRPAALDIVKPAADVSAALADRAAAGRTVVVESLGAQGLRAGGYWARPPRAIAGNATGAGDAAVAALARGLARGTP